MPALKPTLTRERAEISLAKFSCISPDRCWCYARAGKTGAAPRGILGWDGNQWKRVDHDRFSLSFRGPPRWTPVRPENGLVFVSEGRGFGAGAFFYRADEEGNTWRYLTPLGEWEPAVRPDGTLDLLPFTAVFFLNENEGRLAGSHVPGEEGREGALLLHTGNGGQTWSRYPVPTNGTPTAISFRNRRHGWLLIDDRELIVTRDAGRTWEAMGAISIRQRVSQIHLTGHETGWAALDATGEILHTEDGGQTWKGAPRRNLGLRDVYYLPDLRHGWAVMPGAGILRTIDGGKRWHPVDIDDHWYEHPINVFWQVPIYLLIQIPASLLGNPGSLLSPSGV